MFSPSNHAMHPPDEMGNVGHEISAGLVERGGGSSSHPLPPPRTNNVFRRSRLRLNSQPGGRSINVFPRDDFGPESRKCKHRIFSKYIVEATSLVVHNRSAGAKVSKAALETRSSKGWVCDSECIQKRTVNKIASGPDCGLFEPLKWPWTHQP